MDIFSWNKSFVRKKYVANCENVFFYTNKIAEFIEF